MKITHGIIGVFFILGAIFVAMGTHVFGGAVLGMGIFTLSLWFNRKYLGADLNQLFDS